MKHIRLEKYPPPTKTSSVRMIGRGCPSHQYLWRSYKLLTIAGILSASIYNISKSLNMEGIPFSDLVDTNARIRSDSASNKKWCLSISLINSALNVTAWLPLIYHKDLESAKHKDRFDKSKFSSVEEDDLSARSAIDKFNQLRSSVLTRDLLDTGLVPGGKYQARTFAIRLMESMEKGGRPLTIAVFGTSFTIGSNCGESSSQTSDECAWPNRLTQRFQEIITSMFGNHTTSRPNIEWMMHQENSQKSANIAQKLPSIMHDLDYRNITLDAILLDNTISDQRSALDRPWFEVIIRVLVQAYPGAVIISLVDALPSLVYPHEVHEVLFSQRLHQIQRHYNLTVMDIAKMVRFLHHDAIVHNKSLSGAIPVDYLWPQATYMVSSNGTEHGDLLNPMYWANFLPKTQKTKHAHYPHNHPPWATHQYVADAVAYTLLKVLQMGLTGCATDDDPTIKMKARPPVMNETTVSPKAHVDACQMCFSPRDQVDAKSTSTRYRNVSHANHGTVANSNHDGDDAVVVICGDWTWTTDARNRAGWQSEKFGSVIRFRLKVNETPTISLKYMMSHAMFGNLKVSFQTVTKGSTSPPLGCNESLLLPSLELDGSLPKYSLWETTAFPTNIDQGDINSKRYSELLNKAISTEKDFDYIDVYVVNPNEFGKKRIKIQMVISC